MYEYKTKLVKVVDGDTVDVATYINITCFKDIKTKLLWC